MCGPDCDFALKPIPGSAADFTDAGPKSMQVEFYWLKFRPRGSGRVSLMEVPDLPSDHPSCRGNMKFGDCITEQVVRSGDIITLTTHDPEEFPLPNQELLDLQWYMNRVVALSGGVEGLDPVNDDDDGWVFVGRFDSDIACVG